MISRHNECREEIINIACDAYTPSQVRDEPKINLVHASGLAVKQATQAPPAAAATKTVKSKRALRRERDKYKKAQVAQGGAMPPLKEARRKHALDGDCAEKLHGKSNPSGLEDRGDFLIRRLWTRGTDCIGDV